MEALFLHNGKVFSIIELQIMHSPWDKVSTVANPSKLELSRLSNLNDRPKTVILLLFSVNRFR